MIIVNVENPLAHRPKVVETEEIKVKLYWYYFIHQFCSSKSGSRASEQNMTYVSNIQFFLEFYPIKIARKVTNQLLNKFQIKYRLITINVMFGKIVLMKTYSDVLLYLIKWTSCERYRWFSTSTSNSPIGATEILISGNSWLHHLQLS